MVSHEMHSKGLGILLEDDGERKPMVEAQWKEMHNSVLAFLLVLGINEEQISYSPWVSTRNNSNNQSSFPPSVICSFVDKHCEEVKLCLLKVYCFPVLRCK